VLLNLIHEIHNLRMMCGEITAVEAVTSSHTRGFPVEDTAAVILVFASGALGSFLLSDTAGSGRSWEQTSQENPTYATFPDEDCYHVAGTIGSLSVPTMRLKRYAEGVTPSWWSPMEQGSIDLVREDPLTLQMEHFGAVVRGEAEPLCTLHDGAMNVRVVEAIQASARTGARTNVPV
jgi:predicted dehydrogenase